MIALSRKGGPAARILVSVVVGATLVLAGCATQPQPSSRPAGPPSPSPARSPQVIRVPDPDAARVAPAADWQSFARTRAALASEIERRAESLRIAGPAGPSSAGNQATLLASRRMAAKARDLLDNGAADGAQDTAERAISLDGTNGYAWLFLAYIHLTQGSPDRAGEFLDGARRHLPADRGVRSEMEGLAAAIRVAAGSGG